MIRLVAQLNSTYSEDRLSNSSVVVWQIRQDLMTGDSRRLVNTATKPNIDYQFLQPFRIYLTFETLQLLVP